METFITVLVLTAIYSGICTWQWIRYRKSKAQGDSGSQQKLKIIDTLADALKGLSCKYEIDEKDTSISFIFQGEHFIAYDLGDESPFITIADTWWYESPLDDIENLALMRRAVNDCNFNSSATLLYSINTENKTVGLHTRITILWLQQIPNIKDYLVAILNQLLRCHHLFFNKMEELRRLDHKASQKE